MPPTAPSATEQQFLEDLDKKRRNAADRHHANFADAVYKHAVPGLIFFKYVSAPFDLSREGLEAAFRDLARPIFERINHNTAQSRPLAMRASILPTLLSGALPVSAATTTAEASG